jgi:esterase/lipase
MNLPKLSRGAADASIATFLVLVLLGPRVKVDDAVHPVDVPDDVDAWIAASEADVPGIRPGDSKGVVWFDSAGVRTPLSLVYLHGFSADRHELDPVPERLAQALGANLFFTRFTGHGRDAAAMGDVGPSDWFQDVSEAVDVGTRLGDRVIVMGTSTGGTLATWAAGHPELKGDIAALMLVSPNFHPVDRTSRLLLWPWGNQLLRFFVGRQRCWEPANEGQGRHWTTCYPSQVLLTMMGLVERVRTMDLGEVTAPTLALYSPDDDVVDPDETVAAFGRLGAVPKMLRTFDSSTDPSHHVLAGDIMSPESNDAILDVMLAFVEDSGIR